MRTKAVWEVKLCLEAVEGERWIDFQQDEEVDKWRTEELSVDQTFNQIINSMDLKMAKTKDYHQVWYLIKVTIMAHHGDHQMGKVLNMEVMMINSNISQTRFGPCFSTPSKIYSVWSPLSNKTNSNNNRLIVEQLLGIVSIEVFQVMMLSHQVEALKGGARCSRTLTLSWPGPRIG
jgi:hypothetical protein